MSIINKLYSIFISFGKQELIFCHSRKDDESYINEFPEPEDDIQRSYQQYLCQKWEDGSWFRYFCSNLISFFLITPFTIVYRKKCKNLNSIKYDAVVTKKFIKSFLPADFNGSVACQDFNKGSLTKGDMFFIRELKKRYPFSFFFRFKCLCRIAAYSDLIRNYSPKIVFCSAEYSFTSSILTWYCEEHGIIHSNIMHGEKLYMPREAFSRFTEFYVWDDFYIKLFDSLRADKTKYNLSPLKVPNVKVTQNSKKCTYYLQSETEEHLLVIKKFLEQTGKEYIVRPHPLYDTEIIRTIFKGNHIENRLKVDIWSSIANAGIVISKDSTVLYQAFLVGAIVMIDDVSNPILYNQLLERDYIMLNKPHLLMSDAIKENNES